MVEERMEKWHAALTVDEAIALLKVYSTRKFWVVHPVRYVIIDPLGGGLLLPRMVYAPNEFWLEIIDEMRYPVNQIPIPAQMSAVRALFTESRLVDTQVDAIQSVRYRALIIVILGNPRIVWEVRIHLMSLIASSKAYAQLNWFWGQYTKHCEPHHPPEEGMARVVLESGIAGDTSADPDKIDLLLKLAWLGDSLDADFRRLVIDCESQIGWGTKHITGEKEGEEDEDEDEDEEEDPSEAEIRERELRKWVGIEKKCQAAVAISSLGEGIGTGSGTGPGSEKGRTGENGWKYI